MKLSLISALVAGAGLVQVAAVPIRLVVITKTSEGFPAIPDNVATLHVGEPHTFSHVVPSRKAKPGCNGRMSRFRQKSVEISNAFRQALGLPLIQVSHPNPGGPHHEGGFHILPLMPLSPEFQGSSSSSRVSDLPHPRPHHAPPPNVPGPHRHHHPHHHIMNGHKSSFTDRLHHSLMHLGRWEGRAVAFVLGCGIGVLLRMFWVLAVVLYRSIKGSAEQEHEYSHITIIEEYDDDTVPIYSPAACTYPVDEKVAIAPETTVETK